MRIAFALVLGSLLILNAGCAELTLSTVKTAQQRPSNVAIYFKVQDESGDPVGGLTADHFRIYEDSQLVSKYESKQTILNPEVAAAHYTLLLVDMSGSVSESGAVETLVQAVGTFTDRVAQQQKVGMYAFDGEADLHPLAAFTDQPGGAKAGVSELATFKPKDPSTNLNGAILSALDQLQTALGRAPQPLKFGTLVVFTDGTDRANRVPTAVMEKRIRDTPFDVFAIGLGAEIKPSELAAIGKNGTAMAADKTAIVKAFDEVGAKVEGRTRSFYLLSYCSPSRAGKHQVRIEAAEKDLKGNSIRTGSVASDFDAAGFGPGCDPNTAPAFDVTKGDALAPAPSVPVVAGTTNRTKPKDENVDTKDTKDTKPAHKPASGGPPKLPPPPPPAIAPPPAPAHAPLAARAPAPPPATAPAPTTPPDFNP